MTDWLLIVILFGGDTYALRVPMVAGMDAPMQIRAGDHIAVRMTDGSLRSVAAAVCMGPADAPQVEGAGS